MQAWKEALSLIPEPQQFYSETIWFLAAIGDIYFQKKQYEKAHECFDKARGNLSGEGYGNPFVMLRLGECCLEIGDEKKTPQNICLEPICLKEGRYLSLTRTVMMMAKKYFDYLRTHVENIE
ncbi:MAG: tetratricopeptide repeat protein [Roseburia intestinalis]